MNEPLNVIKEKLQKELEEKEHIKVRIALFGKSGAGKSSLINKLCGSRVAIEGVKTDTTQEVAEYDFKGLIFVDLPGYGTTRYTADEYISRFNILDFDVFICVLTDRISADDVKQFNLLKANNKTCIFVRNKQDQIWQEGHSIETLQQEIILDFEEQLNAKETLYFTSCRTGYGIAALEEVIYTHLDAAKQNKWASEAQAYSAAFLSHKKKACKELVRIYAGLSAANGLNPIPGLDVAVDIGLLITLFQKIKSTYGLSEEVLKSKQNTLPAVTQITKHIMQLAGKEGVIALLKRFTARESLKEFSKYVPFVGQAIAASVGFGITYQAGNSFLHDCHKVAEAILNE